jgi:CreA protein
MKKNLHFVFGILVGVVLMIALSIQTADAGARKVGEVECIKRLVQGNDRIKIMGVEDPDNLFVTLYFTTIKSGKLLAFADPSNTSISARLTGKITVVNKKTNLDIASIRKSIGTKVMKIARFYDAEKNVLVYLVYTTKILDGSLKHSISVVPLN